MHQTISDFKTRLSKLIKKNLMLNSLYNNHMHVKFCYHFNVKLHCLLIYTNGSKYKVAAAAVINKDVFLLDSQMKRLYFQPKQWQLNLYTYITQEKLNCCLKLLFSSFLTVLKNNCWVF